MTNDFKCDVFLSHKEKVKSRLQVLCLTPSTLGLDWITREGNTVLFRDPSNTDLRFKHGQRVFVADS